MRTIFVVLLGIFTLTETYSAFSRTAVVSTSAWEHGRILGNPRRPYLCEAHRYSPFLDMIAVCGSVGFLLILKKYLPEKRKK